MSDAQLVQPLARSPIAPAPPVTVLAGWEVSGRQAKADAAGGTGLTITDCTPLAKVQLRAPVGRDLESGLASVAARAPGEHVTWVDLTHGRALMRLTGSRAASVLARVCGIDLSDEITPNGAAFRSSVASVATDMIRDDLGSTRSYLLHCERSAGDYLFRALLRAGAEFGIEIDGFRLPSAPAPLKSEEPRHAIPE